MLFGPECPPQASRLRVLLAFATLTARVYRHGPVGHLARYRKHSNNYMRC